MTDYPEDHLRTVRQCLRRLILPIPFGDEEKAVRAMLAASNGAGIAVEDLPDFIDLRVREWEAGQAISSDFVRVVSGVLGTIARPAPPRFDPAISTYIESPLPIRRDSATSKADSFCPTSL